jgi:hypothetical protein
MTKFKALLFRVLPNAAHFMLLFLCPLIVSAQNGVTVSGLVVNAGTVTFNVSWDKDNSDMPELWSDSVWVFVDYNSASKMTRLPVTAATASAGTVIKVDGNDKGAWVIGNARTNGSFSATVQLLTATANIAGACAYASNYPPVGEYVSDTEISFTGTPMYDIILKHGDGSTLTVQTGSTFLVPCDYTLASFTDATTGAPGIMKSVTPPLAASTRTWVITGNGITQTWSDRINSPADCNKSSFPADNSNPQCRSYTYNNVLYYYYNWPYVNVNRNTLCPSESGWRVPTKDDFVNLDLALGGTGVNRNTSSAWNKEKYIDIWGGVYCGCGCTEMCYLGEYCNIWSSDEYYHLEIGANGRTFPLDTDALWYAHFMRCIRNL